MQSEVSREHALVRRAYELGRMKASFSRALVIAISVGIVAYLVTGRQALVWLPVTLVAWMFAHWRGGAVLRGAFFGLVGGVVTYALPLAVLRPCCSAEAMATGTSCCTMPSACLGAGALLGFALAAFVPLGPSRWRTALGMSLGVGSVAILRCSTLLGAEALGLMGGLLGGVVAATGARLVVARKPAR